MLANVNLAADMDLAAKFGRIIVIGNRGEITVNPRVAMMKELDSSPDIGGVSPVVELPTDPPRLCRSTRPDGH